MHTTLPLSPEEVHETGRREVARIRAEMERVIRKTGFSGTFAEFIALLQNDSRFTVDSEEKYLQAVALVASAWMALCPGSSPGSLRERPTASGPCPSASLSASPRGYYDSGNPYGTRAGFVNINTSDIRARPLYVAESLAFHEGVPGHHLQIMRARENTALSDFRRKLGITVFIEGWGLYAERLGREVGFFQDPYNDFGRLTYEIWRAVRLVVDSVSTRSAGPALRPSLTWPRIRASRSAPLDRRGRSPHHRGGPGPRLHLWHAQDPRTAPARGGETGREVRPQGVPRSGPEERRPPPRSADCEVTGWIEASAA